MSLTSKLVVSLAATLTSAQDLAQGSVPLSLREDVALLSGTGAGRADLIFHDRRTISASSSESLDLAGGLTDSFGATLTFARLKALLVVAAAGNTNNVIVGGAASNVLATMFGDATDTLIVRPGGICLLAAGQADPTAYAVTAATGDLLKIANSGSGTPVTYDVVLIGASA